MAKTGTTIASLEEERRKLLATFALLTEREADREADARDTHDAPLPSPLLDALPLTPEEADRATGAKKFIEWVVGESEEAKRLLIQSDNHMLQAVQQQEEPCATDRPFGFRETVLPLHNGHTIVGTLWSGKYRTSPLSKAATKALAKRIDMDAGELARRLDETPIFSVEEEQRHLDSLHRLRQAVETALIAQDRYRENAALLLESERTLSLGTLSGGVAHHFNNLLSVILGYSSFLLNQGAFSGEAEKALHQISEAAQKGRRLTEEILAFAGSEVEQETACSLHDMLNSVLSLLETQTAGRVHVITRLKAEKDTVRAPRSVLHQTLFNVLTNAIDSMPGGGDLTVTTENATITTAGEPHPHIRLEVLDSGGPTATASKQRRKSTRKSKLSSLYGMVDQLDGSAVVSSEEGLANKAEILLPLDRAITELPIQPPRKKRLSPSLIWIVDDDPIFCEMCDRVLSEDGHEVRIIPSGAALQEEWEKTGKSPDLFIIDFSMPEYNGLELCTWLRDQGSKAPVILVSGFSHTQPDIHKALKMRKTYFLQKPFPVPELADIVTVALGETLLRK